MARNGKKDVPVHLNLNVRGMTPSATVAINERSDALRQEGRRVFKLGLGQSPFPVPAPVVEELRAHAHEKDYLPVMGLAPLRRAIAEYHCSSQGIGCGWQDVLVGPGTKELMFLLQLVYYGDLLIPTPSWVSYAPQAHILGRQVHWVPTQPENHWRLMPEELDKICRDDPDRPRIVILNYPSNPTGATYSTERLREIARVARRYHVVLLSDEIYGGLHHRGQHVSVARFYPEGTIVSNGLSKWCGAGGWRIGAFAFPSGLHWLRDAMAAAASETYTSTAAPIQFAAVRGFQGGLEIERYLCRSRKFLSALGRWGGRRLRDAGAHVNMPLGAFYLFPDFGPLRERFRARGMRTGTEMCERLLEETGVAILPGSEFGRPAEELTARLAYVDFDGARALAAVEELPLGKAIDDQFLRTYAPNVTEAIERLCKWAASEAGRPSEINRG